MAASKIIAMYEEDTTHPILMGLDDEAFSMIRSQILALDLLASPDRIFNMTQPKENHKKIMMARDHKGKAVTFATRAQLAMVEKGACQICGRYAHEETVCYEVLG